MFYSPLFSLFGLQRLHYPSRFASAPLGVTKYHTDRHLGHFLCLRPDIRQSEPLPEWDPANLIKDWGKEAQGPRHKDRCGASNGSPLLKKMRHRKIQCGNVCGPNSSGGERVGPGPADCHIPGSSDGTGAKKSGWYSICRAEVEINPT